MKKNKELTIEDLKIEDYDKELKEIEKFLLKYGPKTKAQLLLKFLNYILFLFIFLIIFLKSGVYFLGSEIDKLNNTNINNQSHLEQTIK